jgi:hypothetical protein
MGGTVALEGKRQQDPGGSARAERAGTVSRGRRLGGDPRQQERLDARDDFDEEDSRQTDNTVSLVLRGNFAFLDSRGTIYGLSPSLALGEGVAFGVTFGMIWSLQRH